MAYLKAAMNQGLIQINHHALLLHVLVPCRRQQEGHPIAVGVLRPIDALFRGLGFAFSLPEATQQGPQEAPSTFLLCLWWLIIRRGRGIFIDGKSTWKYKF